MVYNINPQIFHSAFSVPSDVADKYLKLSKGEHLKVLIYILRNSIKSPTVEEISFETDVSVYDVKEALLFWADAGFLIFDNNSKEKENKKSVKKTLKPSRLDVAKRGLEDQKLSYLLNQIQLIFGRMLKDNEVETFGWLYDDLGMDVSLILFIVQYAKQQGKANIRFIESIATQWWDKGIETIADAEQEIKETAVAMEAWYFVSRTFGIEQRKPSEKERTLSLKWVKEWNISKDLLKKAYDICIDNRSKFSFPYIAKIIENWHKDGINSIDDLDNASKKDQKMQGAYNIDLFEQMLDSKD